MRHLTRLFTSGVLGVGLVLSGGVALAQNSAAVLFPFVTTETGKFTFITIKNTGSSTVNTPAAPITAYHFTYAMKAAPIVNKAECEHFDGDAVTTPADMMIFEVGGKVTTDAGTSALFEGGLTAPVTSRPLTLRWQGAWAS